MTRTHKILVALSALLPAAGLAAAGARIQAGDSTRGASLFRLHCASCHGRDARGDGPLGKNLGAPPTDLRDVAFLLQRGDSELQTAIAQGGKAVKRSFTMPAFASQIAPLDVWDIVAFLRQGQPMISDYFPGAARFAARSYPLEGE